MSNNSEVQSLLEKLNLDDKAKLCSGADFWHLHGIDQGTHRPGGNPTRHHSEKSLTPHTNVYPATLVDTILKHSKAVQSCHQVIV